MSTNLTDKVMGGISIAAVYRIISFPVQFISVILLARLLEPSHFGIFAAALTIVSFPDLLLGQTIRRPLIQIKAISDHHIQSAKVISISLGVVLFILILLIAPSMESLFDIHGLNAVLIVLGLSVLFKSIGATSEALSNRRLEYSFLVKLDFLDVMVNTLLAIYLAYLNFGYWSLVIAYLMSKILRTFVLVYSVRLTSGYRLNGPAAREIFKVARGFYLNLITSYISRNSDKLIVAKFLGAGSLGIYDRGQWLARVPMDFFGLTQSTLFPAVASIQDDRSRLQSAYVKSVGLTAQIGIPMAAAMSIMSEDLVLLFLGKKWEMVIPVAQILAASIFFRMASRLSTTFLLAAGQVFDASKSQVFFALIIVIGCISVVNYGLVSVTLVVIMAAFIHMLVLAVYACRRAGLVFKKWISLQAQGVVLGFVVAIPLIVIDWQNLDSWLSLVLSFSYIVSLFVLLFIVRPYFLLGAQGVWLIEYLAHRFLSYRST